VFQFSMMRLTFIIYLHNHVVELLVQQAFFIGDGFRCRQVVKEVYIYL
jgi:hypothetical protein